MASLTSLIVMNTHHDVIQAMVHIVDNNILHSKTHYFPPKVTGSAKISDVIHTLSPVTEIYTKCSSLITPIPTTNTYTFLYFLFIIFITADTNLIKPTITFTPATDYIMG